MPRLRIPVFTQTARRTNFRAYKKAGTVKGGGTEADHEAYAYTLLNAGIPMMERTSSRIAKAIRGEIQIEDLKVSGRIQSS